MSDSVRGIGVDGCIHQGRVYVSIDDLLACVCASGANAATQEIMRSILTLRQLLLAQHEKTRQATEGW